METRDDFVQARRAHWNELESLVAADKPLARMDGAEISRVAALYRVLANDLMRARSLGCGADVTANLDALAVRVHNLLYAPRPWRARAIWELVARGFPRTLRRSWRPFAIATALFYLPLAFGFAMTLAAPTFAHSVVPAAMLQELAEAYREGFGAGREAGAGSMMTGFYVYNNVGIAFRCFATGILFGAGSVFFLVYNGLVIGAVVGHVTNAGAGSNIATFVSGHGPFELTAIVVAGTAGLRLGWSLIETHGASRLASLRAQGGELFELVSGAALMLLVAALIEAFWSPSSLPHPVKWAFSAAAVLGIAAYLLFAGRRRGSGP